MEEKKIIKHPYYKEQLPKYLLWKALYEGNEAIETNKGFLPRHPFESDKQYNIRLKRATYRNFAKPIVSVFSSSIWRKKPNRDIPGLEKLIDDVDRKGTHANSFFQNIDRKAATSGVQFILVNSSKPPKNAEIRSLADEKRFNIRPYFVPIDPLSIIDWGFVEDEITGEEKLDYIVIESLKTTDTGAFQEHKKEIQYKVWTRTNWETYIFDEKDKMIKKLDIPDSEGTHPCGEVPIIPCYFEEYAPMVGKSSLSDVARLCLRIFWRDSEYDKSLFDTAIPLLLLKGFDENDRNLFIKSSSNGIWGDGDCDGKYVEPEGRAFEAVRQALLDDEKSIREIALRMLRPDSKVGESAESKKIDKLQLDSQLGIFAYNCEEAEKKCWELAAKWLKNSKSKIEVNYNKDFDIDQISSDLVKALMELRNNQDLSRDRLWKVLQQMEFPLGDDFDPVEEKTLIENENRVANRVLPDLSGSFLSQTNPNQPVPAIS